MYNNILSNILPILDINTNIFTHNDDIHSIIKECKYQEYKNIFNDIELINKNTYILSTYYYSSDIEIWNFIHNYIIPSDCIGGILIIPSVFWTKQDYNSIKLRHLFLKKYIIKKLNIFEESIKNIPMFISAFEFILKSNSINRSINYTGETTTDITIYPYNYNIHTVLTNNYNKYIIGGEIYKLTNSNNYTITVLTNKNNDLLDMSNISVNLILKTVDDDTSNINLFYDENYENFFIDNVDIYDTSTNATNATNTFRLLIEPKINKYKQVSLANKFNKYFNTHRELYKSLFLQTLKNNNKYKKINLKHTLPIILHILDTLE